jgi:hypothetical protein
MKKVTFLSVLLCFFFLAFDAQAQGKLPKIELNVNNPLVQSVIKKALQEYIPKVTGKDEKVKSIDFRSNKKVGETIALKGTVLFENPKAALGNGNYRFKLKMNSNLLQPKIHYLKLQVFRVWFIRFYRRVI